MLYEVEIRACVKDLEALRESLVKLNCQKRCCEELCDLVYSPTRRGDFQFHIRLRVKEDCTLLDCKQFVEGVWSDPFVPTRVNDLNSTAKILLTGYSFDLFIHRRRTEYVKDVFLISIDELYPQFSKAYFPVFIEVELSIESLEGRLCSERRILELISQLGIPESDLETRPYGDIIVDRLRTDPNFKSEFEAAKLRIGHDPTQCIRGSRKGSSN